MLFKEFVKQHGVHRFIPHGVDVAFLVAHHQVGVNLGHFFGDQTKLRHVFAIALVVERDRFQAEDRLAGVTHRLDLFLESPRRTSCAKLAIGTHENWYTADKSHPAYPSDNGHLLHSSLADTDSIRFANDPPAADIDIVIACVERGTSEGAQCDVVATDGVEIERLITDGRVSVA